MAETQWRVVEGFPSYEVSDRGEVRRIVTSRGIPAGTLLKPVPQSSGHLRVSLCGGGRIVTRNIHRLVGEAFIGHLPEGLHTNHIDGDKTNNAVGNLEYLTPAENAAHAARLGLLSRGANRYNTRLTDAAVIGIRRMRRGRVPGVAIAAMFGVTTTCISRIGRRSVWTHI